MDAVLNWLWQGCAVALTLGPMLRLLERARAQTRYVVCWAALLFVLVLPFVRFFEVAPTPVVAPTVSAAPGAIVSIPTAWWTSSLALIAAWALWVGIVGIRILGAVLAVRRAKTCSHSFPTEVERSLHHWRRLRERGRPANLVTTYRVRAAAVLGWGSPVIAVAPTLVEHLDADDLDRVVIHEWAHVQRRDDLANLLQLLVRLIAGWHPALWWIDRRLQIERELACDEVTVAVTGSAKSYAACLVKLAALPRGTLTTLAALSALSSTGLHARITRLVSRRELASVGWSRGAATAVVALLCALSLTIGKHQLVRAAAVSPSVETQPTVVLARGAQPKGVELLKAIDLDDPSTGDTATPIARQASTGPVRTPAPRVAPVPAAVTVADIPDAPASNEIAADSGGSVPLPIPLESVAIDGSVGLIGAPHMQPPAAAAKTRAPWNKVADAGVAIGRGSKNAGVATGGFFTRFAKHIAGSF